MGFADVTDLEAHWRPLSDAEGIAAEVWLAVAEAALRARIPTVDADIASGLITAGTATLIVVSMVRDANFGVEKLTSERLGDYAYTRPAAGSAAAGGGASSMKVPPWALTLLTGAAESEAFSIKIG